MVGVFVDELPGVVLAHLQQVDLDLAQLHGSEPPVEVHALRPRAFKAIRPRTRGDAEAMAATYAHCLNEDPDLPHFLLDTYHPWKMGGTGQSADWAIGQVLARRFRILLAGGLTANNVGSALGRVQPWGVDVVSGVEQAPGIKDYERLRAFMSVVRHDEEA
jgi:phosphoribosylanthranilate isomerase